MFSCLGLYREYVADLSMLKRKALHVDGEMAPAINRLNLEDILSAIQKKKAVVIIGKGHNDAAKQAVQMFKVLGVNDCEVIDLDQAGGGREGIERALLQLTCRSLIPLVFVKGDCVGNVNDLAALRSKGVLAEWLKDHEFDLIVVGGGSGGLAAAQEAANLGKKVACLDYVVPTPLGTTWGLGGTCVNVGCIPKKLMHHAALLGQLMKDAQKFGWQYDEKSLSLNWGAMKDGVQAHISSLNWGSRVALREKKVKYLNSYGKFIGSHTILATDKNKATEQLSADRFLIATGLRPRYLDIPGAKEYCITSDDLFKLPYPPGKTLVVGASYVALECAGFLHGTGFDVTVMVRSILLRGFDQDMAERIGNQMASIGIRFIKETIPTKVELIKDGTPRTLRVTAKSNSGEVIVGEYNTVLLGIGRDAITDNIGLEVAGIKRNEKNKKIVCWNNEQSVSAPYVFAVGDVLDGGIELTPVAIQAGRLLMRRLFSGSTTMCDYINVPTTVFTPLEYGCCGYSEEGAFEKFGADSIEVYHVQMEPLEFTVPKRTDKEHCYLKMICNKKDDLRVVGFHILGPNAGEVTQGFAIGLKLNAKKADFDRLIGIHPTVAENFTTLKVTKASNESSKGGKC